MTATVGELAPSLLLTAFENFNPGRKFIDLWTILTAPYAGDNIAVYNAWLEIKSITAEKIVQWKHGPEVSALQDRRPTGVQDATRIIKTLRMMDEETRGGDMRRLNMTILEMELDYTMLLRGINQHVIDHMLSGNKQRVVYLLRVLSDQAPTGNTGRDLVTSDTVVEATRDIPASEAIAETNRRVTVLEAIAETNRSLPALEVIAETTGNTATKESVSEGRSGQDLEQIVLGFRQELNSEHVPRFVGYGDVVEMLDDLIRIPQLFKHLIKPHSHVGFQGILLFGPPGTGKTLLAQTLASKNDLAFFKVAADQRISKWVGDTEK